MFYKRVLGFRGLQPRYRRCKPKLFSAVYKLTLLTEPLRDPRYSRLS